MNKQQDILQKEIIRLQKQIDKEKVKINKLNSFNCLDKLKKKELKVYKDPIENIIKKAENIIHINKPFTYKKKYNSDNCISLEENSKEIINELIEKYNENLNYLQKNNYILKKDNENLQKKIKKRKIKKGKQKKNNNCSNTLIIILLIVNFYLYNKN